MLSVVCSTGRRCWNNVTTDSGVDKPTEMRVLMTWLAVGRSPRPGGTMCMVTNDETRLAQDTARVCLSVACQPLPSSMISLKELWKDDWKQVCTQASDYETRLPFRYRYQRRLLASPCLPASAFVYHLCARAPERRFEAGIYASPQATQHARHTRST